MDVDGDQDHLLSNSPILVNDADTPLVDDQPNEEVELIPIMAAEPLDWNTSLLSQICREGDMCRLRLFIEYSRQTKFMCAYASEMVDRLDVDTNLSPLHHAARYQQLDICVMLLSNFDFEFGLNMKDADGRTPMHSAFRLSNKVLHPERPINLKTDLGNKIKDLEVWQEEYPTKILPSIHPLIYLFAQANGDINARDKYLLTPLHCAIARNSLAGVKQLTELNADVEAEDRQGLRPIHLACKEGYLSIVDYLIEKGITIDAIDADGYTPFHYACAKGHLEIMKLIEIKENIYFDKLIRMQTNTKATCLHLAVQNGDLELVEYILKKFTNGTLKIFINEQTEPFGTPLHIAAKFCDPPMLSLLCHYGADPSIINTNEQTSLHIASVSNRLSIVRELYNLTQISLLEIKDNHSQTPLSVTTDPDIISQLIEYGADISSLDNNDMNVLMSAVSTGQIAVVDRLLSAVNDQLITIFDQVEQRNDRSIFLIAVRTGSVDMCSLLLTHPYIRWDTIDKQRMNAFHIAARHNHYELIKFLCDHIQKSNKLTPMNSRSYSNTITIDSNIPNIQQTLPILRLYIDAQNEDGKTPLHLASEQGHTFSVKVLLHYNADVLLPNYLGQLALHVAIQNGHSQCVDLLVKACKKHLNDFRSVLSRRQSPLNTACQNGFTDIVQVLLAEHIGVHHGMDFDNDKEDNPLEIAIKYRHVETVHALLEHPHTEHWLMSIKNNDKYNHQTPLRNMIRHMPECAKHAFDKLIIKTTDVDFYGEEFERTVYKYKYIDDYFTNEDKLYTTSSHQLYRNHPFIIALDCEHYSLLEHPLVQLLMLRKWKLYRPLFYFPRILSLLLLLVLTIHVLITPAPDMKIPSSKTIPPSIMLKRYIIVIRWIIVVLSGMNLFKIIVEIILYRGLRIPFAQLFGIVSFISPIIAFGPFGKLTNDVNHWHWQFASFSILIQWFNIAVIFRSVPFCGKCLFMLQSIIIKFILLMFAVSPLLIAFTISTQMIFSNHPSFGRITYAMHKSSAMFVGEFDYDTLFFSKPIFTISSFIFIPFIVLMAVVFMNIFLGITVGDTKTSMKKARAKADAYWIRELIYIESTLPSTTWLKSNTIEQETVYHYLRDSVEIKSDKEAENGNDEESLANHPHAIELSKLSDILDMLCIQAKQALEYEIHLEQTLKQLLTTRKTQS